MFVSTRAFPDMQLNALEKQLQKGAMKDELKLRYLELVCKMRPDSTIQVLKLGVFPIEQSYQICQSYKNLHAMAFLESRLRDITKALRSYIKVLTIDDQMMLKAFDSYLEQEHAEAQDSYNTTEQMSLALFSYHCMTEILEKELEESFDEAEKYFDNLLLFFIQLMVDLDSKEERVHNESLELNIKFGQLRNFIKKQIFDDFFLLYANRIGPSRLIEVLAISSDNQFNNCQISEAVLLYRTHVQPHTRKGLAEHHSRPIRIRCLHSFQNLHETQSKAMLKR